MSPHRKPRLDAPGVKRKRLAVRTRMRRASGSLSLVLDTAYPNVAALREAVMAWQAGELQEAERDVQSIIAERETSSTMGAL